MDLTAAAVSGYKKFLRRKFSGNLPALRALADQCADSAQDQIVITTQSFEGGSHSGQVILPRLVALDLVETLLIELDPTSPRPCTTGVAVFR